MLVGHTDHRRFEHAGVLHGDFLDLARIDVETGDQHHVLLAIDDARGAGFVHDADVARLEEAVGGHDVSGFVRAVPVAGHHLRPANADLA